MLHHGRKLNRSAQKIKGSVFLVICQCTVILANTDCSYNPVLLTKMRVELSRKVARLVTDPSLSRNCLWIAGTEGFYYC